MSFHDPWWLYAFLIPLVVLWRVWNARGPSLRFPETRGLQEIVKRSLPHQLRWSRVLRVLALALIVLALARPQEGLESTRIQVEGIDIALVIDVSSSMLAEDFVLDGRRHNRLEIVKEVVKSFILERKNDRLSLVIFGGSAYTASPMTLDYGWLLAQLEQIQIGMVEDGTAVGSAIATAVNRLRDSKAKSRIIILLTDGVNNVGSLTPDAAAELAAALNIKIYTIGVGTQGAVPYPMVDPFGRRRYRQVTVDMDEASLMRVAKRTQGKYYNATDTESLRMIYEDINLLEKTKIDEAGYFEYRERYPLFVGPALLILLLALGLDQTWLRILP